MGPAGRRRSFWSLYVASIGGGVDNHGQAGLVTEGAADAGAADAEATAAAVVAGSLAAA